MLVCLVLVYIVLVLLGLVYFRFMYCFGGWFIWISVFWLLMCFFSC